MATTDGPLTRHPLLRQHIEGGMALSSVANWNQNEADWRLFFELGFGMGYSDQNGRLCATTMIIPLGSRFAWISVVLVAEDMRRRGLASQLTEWATDELNRMGVVPYLDATPAGREVYLRLGFQDCWWLERLVAQTPAADFAATGNIATSQASRGAPVIRPIDDAIWPRVVEYDARIFGSDRSAILAPFRHRVPAAALYAIEAGQVVGFVLARDGRLTTQVGPLCADRAEIAFALLTHALSRVGYPVCIDLPVRHAPIRDWLCANGFAVGRPFARMALGRADTFDDRARLIASAGPEFG
ncbi:MAG: GNAT family N-acetyltransferase [Betaproteobacteria bacterium]|nr:GNAT family N-acetyltransferase [Betaproteobacteria bacterium]